MKDINKRLTLPLKKKWFNMIKSGEKLEEYREITEYWIRRFINKEHWYELPNPYSIICECILQQCDFDPFKDFDEIEFTCGYPKKGDKERRIVFKNPKICVTYGIQDWGAEHGKKYFVITWDKVKIKSMSKVKKKLEPIDFTFKAYFKIGDKFKFTNTADGRSVVYVIVGMCYRLYVYKSNNFKNLGYEKTYRLSQQEGNIDSAFPLFHQIAEERLAVVVECEKGTLIEKGYKYEIEKL